MPWMTVGAQSCVNEGIVSRNIFSCIMGVPGELNGDRRSFLYPAQMDQLAPCSADSHFPLAKAQPEPQFQPPAPRSREQEGAREAQ